MACVGRCRLHHDITRTAQHGVRSSQKAFGEPSMNADVAKLKQKLNSKRFATVHHRQSREDSALQEVIDQDILKYVPPLEGYVYGAVPEQPKSRYVKVSENNLADLLPHFNQLLLYRILRLLYGPPDILSAYASPSDGAVSPVDWGYCFSVQPDLVGEIRNKFTSRVYLSYWGPKEEVTPETLSERQQRMASCLN